MDISIQILEVIFVSYVASKPKIRYIADSSLVFTDIQNRFYKLLRLQNILVIPKGLPLFLKHL